MATNTLSGAPQSQADDYSDFEPVHDYSGFTPASEPWANDPVVGQLDGSDPWANDPVAAYPGAVPEAGYAQGYATRFADQADLAAYHNAIANGASEEQALAIGDNGIGHEDLGTIQTSQSRRCKKRLSRRWHIQCKHSEWRNCSFFGAVTRLSADEPSIGRDLSQSRVDFVKQVAKNGCDLLWIAMDFNSMGMVDPDIKEAAKLPSVSKTGPARCARSHNITVGDPSYWV